MPTNINPLNSHRDGTSRAWRAPIASLLASLLAATLVACGGGGGSSSAGVGTGGTGSFAVGTISGFGSIIVNGVRYDDRNASVVDDDDDASSSGALATGQVVELRGEVASDGLTGTASSVSFFSELKGPITAVGANSVTVFGQVVNVNATTVYANATGLAALAVGNVIEVYGLPAAGGAITATRIELEAGTVAAYGGDFRVRGVVSGLVATTPGQRFTVGTVLVQTDGNTRTEGTVANGVFVKVRLNKTVNSDTSYTAVRVKVKKRAYESGVNKAEVQGLVSEFTTLTAPFKVNGYPVQLDTSVTYVHGVAGNLTNGVRIEAKGAVSADVLVIRKVKFDAEDNDGGDDGDRAPFEFHGVATCSATSCGSLTGSFVLRSDVNVQYNTTTKFVGVTSDKLNGAKVEVKAIAQSGPGGTTWLATRIKLDN